ncbi:putative encoded peptide [Helianthus annuus]|nr:putative encoded peptide [Helianthus annuus]KAJ0868001.1 putative encoded peptide [Helianthus annuus]
MVNFQIVTHCIFFLIIACHAILLVEGRQLKPLKKEMQAKHTLSALQKPLRTAISFQVSSTGRVPTAFRPITPGSTPGAGHSFTEHGLGSSSKAVANGFKPTKPGNSPGAGHSIHIQFANP